MNYSELFKEIRRLVNDMNLAVWKIGLLICVAIAIWRAFEPANFELIIKTLGWL